jgi:hypothetical protein
MKRSRPKILIGWREPLRVTSEAGIYKYAPAGKEPVEEDAKTPPHIRDRKGRVSAEVLRTYSPELQEAIKEKRVLWKQQSLALDDPFVNRFLEIWDLKSFSKFVSRYGLAMFKEDPAYRSEIADLIFMFVPGSIDQNSLAVLWASFEKAISNLQAEIRQFMSDLASSKDVDAAWQEKHIKPPMEVKNAQHDKPVIVQHYKGIRDACLFSVFFNRASIGTCSRSECKNLYLKRSDRHSYCSENCKYEARRAREATGIKFYEEKNVMISRVNRRRDMDKITKQEARAAIRGANSKTTFADVKKLYGLVEPRPRGPKPKKGE